MNALMIVTLIVAYIMLAIVIGFTSYVYLKDLKMYWKKNVPGVVPAIILLMINLVCVVLTIIVTVRNL